MLRLFICILISLFLVAPIQASEEDVQAAYQAYRDAQRSGDLRVALPHAQTALDAAVIEWGANTPETYRYIAALGRLHNDLRNYPEAINLISPAITADQEIEGWLPHSFELYFEAGRTLRGLNNFENSQAFFDLALQIAEANYGANSRRAAYAHMELARSHPDFNQPKPRGDLRHRILGTDYLQGRGNLESQALAIAFFNQNENMVVEQQIMQTIRAGNLMAQGNMIDAGDILESAMPTLVANGYMDDYALTLYVDWIGSHLGRWNTRRLELNLLQALEYGALRQEGIPIPLARTTGIRSSNNRVCLDQQDDSHATLVYSVDAGGQVPRTAIVDTNMRQWWQDEQRSNMRNWAFIPAQKNGEAVRVDGLRRYVTIEQC